MGDDLESFSPPDALRTALGQFVDAVVIVDEDNRILFFNAAAERFWGIKSADVVGELGYLLTPKGLIDAGHGHIDFKSIVRIGDLAGQRFEFELEKPDGTTAWGALTLSKVSLDVGVCYIAVVKNITREYNQRERLGLISLASDTADRAVIITGLDDRAVYINQAFSDLFGYEAHEVIGVSPRDMMIGPKTDRAVLDQFDSHALARQPFDSEIVIYGKSGREIWVSASVKPVFDDQGVLKNWIGVHTNINSIKQLQLLKRNVLDALASYHSLADITRLICERVEGIEDGLVCAVFRLGEDNRLKPLAAPSFPERMYEGAFRDGFSIGPDLGTAGKAAFLGVPIFTADISTDPGWSVYRDTIQPLTLKSGWAIPTKSRDGKVSGVFAVYFRQKMEPTAWHKQVVEACVNLCGLAIDRDETTAHIAQLAHYDTLTGLANRTLLVQQIGQAISSARWIGQTFAVLFLDVDGLKEINKSMGYHVGNEVIIQVARRIQSHLGADDIVGRLAGDEFAIVLPGADAHRAALVAQALLHKLGQPLTLDHTDCTVSASIGIAICPDDGAAAEELLQQADAAVLEAKNAGRRTYRFSNQEYSRQARERVVVEAGLRNALIEKRLQLHYQPQIRLRDGAIYGVEALARWTDPVLGEIMPERFIPIAEASGLIEELGFWSIETACAQLAAWRRSSILVPQLSVNLSALQFRNNALPDKIAMILSNAGLCPQDLILEITESVMVDRNPEVVASLQAIQTLGVRLSIDDFGTGYSSLSSLARLPVHELKIDRSFIQNIDADAGARTIVSAVIGMGRSLNLTVVAEGVETPQQSSFLQSLACDVGQGYLFAHPLGKDDFEQWYGREPEPTREVGNPRYFGSASSARG